MSDNYTIEGNTPNKGGAIIMPNDPMRGFQDFEWMKLAKDPNANEHPTAGMAHTLSSQVDGKEILYPSVRHNEEGIPIQYGPVDAQRLALENNDFLQFNSEEDATAWSKNFSEEIGRVREPQLEQKPAPPVGPETPQTPALLMSEATEKYGYMLDYLSDVASSEDSEDRALALINEIENKIGDFDLNSGYFQGLEVGKSYDKAIPTEPVFTSDAEGNTKEINPYLKNRRAGLEETNLLAEMEKRFPVEKSTPGAAIIKAYLKDKINTINRPLLYKGPVGAVDTAAWIAMESGKSVINAVDDLSHVANRIGYDAVEGVLSVGYLLMSEPVRQIAKIGAASDLEAEAFAQKVFSLSGWGLEKSRAPNTLTGQIAEPFAQVGSSIYLGGKMLGWTGQFMRKWMPQVGTAITSYTTAAEGVALSGGAKLAGRVVSSAKDPAMVMGAKEALGSPTFISKENTLAAFLHDMGADDPITEWLMGSESDSEAMERFKKFANGGFEGFGINATLPAFGLMFRSLFNLGRPVATEAYQVGSNFWTKVEQFFPKASKDRLTEVVDADGKVVSLKDPNAAAPTKLESVQKVKAEAKKQIETLLTGKQAIKFKKDLAKRGFKMDKNGNMTPIIKVKGNLINKRFKKGEKEKLINSIISDPASVDFHNSTQKIFNVNRFSSRDDIKAAINQASVMIDATTKKTKRTNAQIRKDAQRVDQEITEWVGEENKAAWFKSFGLSTDATPAQAAALRQYLFEESEHFVTSAKKLHDIIKSGVEPTSAEYVEYYLDIYKFLGVMETDIKVAGNIARTLQNRRAILSAPEHVLDNIIEGAKDSGLDGRSTLAVIAKNIGIAEDPLQLKNQLTRHSSQYHIFEGAKQTAVNGLLSNVMTQASASLGILWWGAQNGIETYAAASLNAVGKKLNKHVKDVPYVGKAANALFGTGEGMSFTAANAQMFGRTQALLEVFVGRGHFTMDRGAIAAAIKGMKTLDSSSVSRNPHELADQFVKKGGGVRMTIGKDEWEIGSGINEKMFIDFFGADSGIMKSQAGAYMRLLANTAGLINSAAGRGLVMQDAFYRNVIERGEIHRLSVLRAEAIERSLVKGQSISKGEMAKRIQRRYIQVMNNLPEDIAEKAALIAEQGLMQKKPGAIVRGLEKGKNKTFDWGGHDANFAQKAVSVVGNIATTYLTSKASFMRTMSNIFKESIWERGPLVIPRVGLSKKQRELWATNEAFRQETVAKFGTGTLMIGVGTGLGVKTAEAGYEYILDVSQLKGSWAGERELMDEGGKESPGIYGSHQMIMPSAESIKATTKQVSDSTLYMEGIDAGDPKQRFMRQVRGLQGPEILLKDHNTGKVTSFPLARLDIQKAPLVLGSIFGSYGAQLHEALTLKYMDVDGNMIGNFDEEEVELIKEINMKAGYAFGNWVLDIPMAQGIKDLLHNLPVGFSPVGTGSLSKEVSSFLTEFLNPVNSFYSAARKGVHKTTDQGTFKTFSEHDSDTYVDDITEEENISLNVGLGVSDVRERRAKKKNLFSTKKGAKFYELIMIADAMRDATENLSIMDVTNVEYPRVGQKIFTLVGPGGGMLKNLADTERDKLERGIKLLGLPWYPKEAVRSETIDLITGLGIVYDDPRRWKIPSKNAGGTASKEKIHLSAEQKFVWAVENGKLNSDFFVGKKWKDLIHSLDTGMMNHPRWIIKKRFMKELVEDILKKHQEASFQIMLGHPNNIQLARDIALQNQVDKLKGN